MPDYDWKDEDANIVENTDLKLPHLSGHDPLLEIR